MNELLQQAYDEQHKAYLDYIEAEKILANEAKGFISKHLLDLHRNVGF